MIKRSNNLRGNADSGAALVTVIFLTFILLIACVAMLSAVGAGTANSADVLAESKAYYASESGLQAAINVLRNTDTNGDGIPDGLDYKTALSESDTIDGDLSSYLSYCTSGACSPPRVVFANGANMYDPNVHPSYRLSIADPDNTASSLTFYTVSGFLVIDDENVDVSEDFRTVYFPSSTANPRTEVTITSVGSTGHTFAANPALATFSINKVGGGVPVPEVNFRIDYVLTAPRAAVRSIRGNLVASAATDPVQVEFLSQEYLLLGSEIELCSTDTSPGTGADRCPTVTFSLTTENPSATLYGDITSVEPFRLLIKSTGFGPNGAKKTLEGIVQKDLFNGLASGAATSLIGTSETPPGGLPFLFSPGDSSQVYYDGGDCSSGPCVPSFGLTNPENLDYVTNNPPNDNPNQMQPPPALLGNEIPDWQQTPAALDALISSLRTAAQNSGRYFVNPTGEAANFQVGSASTPPGSFATGEGITFCEGSCKMGADGGGILVVTGKLTNVGGFSFRGLIIVTGEEGWERNGGGNGQVIGNVVVAPYNRRSYIPANHSASFLAPRYYITGGGNSDVIYDDVSAGFDDITAISNIMLGVSEK